jgi:predicted transcriptional regulator
VQRRDSTCIFYDILFLATKGVSKTRLRRELGLSFYRSEERLGFLLENGHLRRESDGGTATYYTSVKGHRLLYFMSAVDEELGKFFLARKGKCFTSVRSVEVERGITDLLFSLQNEATRRINRIPRLGSDLDFVPDFPWTRDKNQKV